MDKKSLRRARAKILQERSKVVGPLEKKARELENTIERLEAEAAAVLEEFHKASVAGEGAAIAEYSRQNDRIKAEIDARFDELESATREFEDAAKEFGDIEPIRDG